LGDAYRGPGGGWEDAKRRRRSLKLLCLALLAPTFAGTSAPAASAARDVDSLLAPASTCPESARIGTPIGTQLRAMNCLVEYARSRAGLQGLRPSRELDRVATSKVEADVRCGEFTHTPCGVSFVSTYFRVGYARAAEFVVGENLAWAADSKTSPRDIMRMWLHSPPHLRNLLEPEWRDCGLAVLASIDFLGHRGAVLWATEFGARRDPLSSTT
jgi:uncharacterized protein YkwD